jgi:serine/threonine protein kinase/DNA polymerase III delta prime subunit
MKIDIISSDGIHASEKDALQRMREAFNASEFSQGWQGYAGFMMMDTTYRDREIDLVLLTHDRLLLIELKNWRGKIEPMQDHWLRDGVDMGRSPVKVLADKWKILSSKIRNRLIEPARSTYIDYRVVMCGQSNFSEIPDDEKKFILTLDNFLKISKKSGYNSTFDNSCAGKPNQHIPEFTQFFRGKEFKPSIYSFANFQIVGEATFPHPDGLYKEYKAVKKDDQRHEALLRRWDFSTLTGVADTIDERARIALREHKVLGYIHQQCEELDAVVLQPLSHPTRDDIDADFCELYRLPSRQLRLNEFVQRHGPDMPPNDRVAMAKILLSHFADLHDAGIAHRDISDHSIWLERPTKVSISSFLTAYFPEAGTVGPLRSNLKASGTVLPEDSDLGKGEPRNAFQGDVYLLAIAVHHILFLRLPGQQEGIYHWEDSEVTECPIGLKEWFIKALDIVPSTRFPNARAMLDSLNKLQLGKSSKAEIDLRAFEPYRSEVLPVVSYPIEETIKHGHNHLYRSTVGGKSVAVKIWYGRRPDPKRPEDTHVLKTFLDKARLLRTQPCPSIAPVVDFGLSDAGAFLVQEWTEGHSILVAATECTTSADLLSLCHRLVQACRQLHGLGLHHGDLHPENVLVATNHIRFIDAVDMLQGGSSPPRNVAYSPLGESSSVSAEQLDCYAVAKICDELLSGSTPDPEIDYSALKAEIQRCLDFELRVYALDHIDDALHLLLHPAEPEAGPRLVVRMSQLTSLAAFAGDNGHFYIEVSTRRLEKQAPRDIAVNVSGIRKTLTLHLNIENLELLRIKSRDISHSQFVRMAQYATARMKCEIEFHPAPTNDANDLLKALLDIPEIYQAIKEEQSSVLNTHEIEVDDASQNNNFDDGGTPSTGTLWRAILDAEEATLPEIEIAGTVSRETGHREKLRIPYRKDGEALDYESGATVEALQEINGELFRVGDVDIKETTQAILVLNNTRFRIQTSIGDRIKLRSQQDYSSFRRRHLAVTRVLDRESVLPELIDYFDPALAPLPLDLGVAPTNKDLDIYNRYDSEGNLIFSLNHQQREAFAKLWCKGPLSLLQGPPGTGKTSFIASFIHYAMSHGAQSILLASQSHEAVNNAAEKAIELCQRTDLPLDVVRFGAEGMVSDQLRPHHSASVLQAYRDLFRSEMRQRIVALNRNLGLPNKFVETFFDIKIHLERLLEEVDRLRKKIETNDIDTEKKGKLSSQINQRIDRFRTLAREKFGIDDQIEEKEIVEALRRNAMQMHGVTSPNAIAKLDQIMAIAQEWVDRLGTLRGNFEEFLAKTRSLVCGTCVGLGRSQFGIAKNRYDWVIVDEAARATPGELAVAIQSGRRILLVGDHRQLPPHYDDSQVRRVASDLNIKELIKLTRSDFERAFESDYGKKVGATLQTQYRMAPPIGDLVSASFYPVALQPGRGGSPAIYETLPERLRAVVTWVDTSDTGKKSHERPMHPGFENIYEAQEIMDLLRSICACGDFMQSLIADCADDERPIGVICMYAHQQRLLQRLLSEQDWATAYRRLIKIDTVDSYQGKENRIIIVATTRHNDRFDQGFMASRERVNVALSRAMERLVIIGAARMWRERHQRSAMGQVLSYIEAHRDGKSFSIIQASHVEAGLK